MTGLLFRALLERLGAGCVAYLQNSLFPPPFLPSNTVSQGRQRLTFFCCEAPDSSVASCHLLELLLFFAKGVASKLEVMNTSDSRGKNSFGAHSLRQFCQAKKKKREERISRVSNWKLHTILKGIGNLCRVTHVFHCPTDSGQQMTGLFRNCINKEVVFFSTLPLLQGQRVHSADIRQGII